MRKFIKIIIFLFVGFLALLVLAAIAVRFFFPPEKVKKLVDQQIRAQLHREAKLQDVHMNLRGLTLTGFQLSEVPSFSAGTFLSVEKADVRWALAPLLSKHVSIKHIVFEKPQITLIKMADGKTMNVTDLAGAGGSAPAQAPAKKEPAQAKRGASAWTWKINEIRLKQGQVRYEDRAKAALNSTLSDINLTVSDFSLDRMQGTLGIGKIENTFYKGKDFSADWALKHLDPSLAHVTGFLKLKQGPGIIRNINELANISNSAKIALTPLLTLQNLSKTGFVNLGLPDLSHLNLHEIQGDYALTDGLMKINQLHLNGPEVSVAAPGTINLATGALSMDIALHTPKPTMLGETDLKLHVGGTLAHPTTDIESLKKKAFKAGVKNMLSNPDSQKKINKALQDLFH